MSEAWRWGLVAVVVGIVPACSGTRTLGEWPASGVSVHSIVTEERPDPAWQAFSRLAALTPEEAEQQLPGALAAFQAQRTADARLWVLLLLLKAPYREFGGAWASEVLDAVGGGERPPELRRDLEAFLRHLFAERLAREEALQRAETSRDEARDAVRALQGSLTAERGRVESPECGRAKSAEHELADTRSELRSAEAALEAERARVRELEAQLEQLTNIEKILQRREGDASGKGTP